MDNDLSKIIEVQQNKLVAIQEKLKKPELNNIQITLASSDCLEIRNELLKNPDLFLLLLDNPTFGVFLTENTRQGFLTDIKNNPEKIISSLQKNTQANTPPTVTAPQQETDILEDAANYVGNIYLDTKEFLDSYTPSLDSIRERFSNFADTLDCGETESLLGSVDGMEVEESDKDDKKKKRSTV